MNIILYILTALLILAFMGILYYSTENEKLKNKVRVSDYEYNLIRCFRRIDYEFQFANFWLKELAEGNKKIMEIMKELEREENELHKN